MSDETSDLQTQVSELQSQVSALEEKVSAILTQLQSGGEDEGISFPVGGAGS
jgi:outer membrane murein-binding lipoprotein Lpp